MIPTAALVLPVDDTRLELDAGVGLAAVLLRVNRDVDAFVRADFATLLLSGPVAVRDVDPSLGPHDNVWMTLSLGFAIRT